MRSPSYFFNVSTFTLDLGRLTLQERFRSALCDASRLKNVSTFQLFNFSTFIIALAMMMSCNTISEDERLIYVKQPDAKRTVLIEDFTGQKCINCPNAADKIAQLKKDYGHNIIAVGIHSGPLAVYSRGKILGLRTAEGDEYYNHWNIQEEPTGYINRTGEISTIDKWDKLVREAIEQTTPVTMNIYGEVNEETREIHFFVRTLTNKTIDAKLQLWVTESGITAQQAMPDGSNNSDYVHNHVFRTSINGTWGTDLKLQEYQDVTQEFTFQVPQEWVMNNLSIVAFIYDETGVLQACEM